ncbi:MAG: class II fructose-bisphosphate aldolase [Planctomycetes bacterium]|nr:class II fructose-bisphosphate aldolase [Planctomycetota bacterium]
MAIITGRARAAEWVEEFRRRKASMALFCTASPWNTEAILLAARRFGDRHGIEHPCVGVGMTFTYKHMPQAKRVHHADDARAGFRMVMAALDVLAGEPDSPYASVVVLPHLDHAHPERDRWALTEGLPHLASVMFDAQEYPSEENVRLTAEYVAAHGREVLVEGILEMLAVVGKDVDRGSGETDASYIDRAVEYVRRTNVDLLVGDLGTEQQATTVGTLRYRQERAKVLTERLGKAMLVLHGTSCLNPDQMASLAEDGVIRTNMWTRIAREAGLDAAEKLAGRMARIREGEFEAADPRTYLRDATERAASVMEEVLGILGYARLAGT